jgi:hypothetical protein
VKRAYRWLLNSIAAILLVMSVATLTLYFRWDRLDSIYLQADGRIFVIDLGPRWTCFYLSLPSSTTDRGWYLWHVVYAAGLDFPRQSVWNRLGFWHYHETHPELFSTALLHNKNDIAFVQDQFFLPVWLISVVCSVIPLMLIWSRLKFTYARTTSHCPVCGYDLRATPDRCPECGTIPPSNRANAAD